MSARAERATTCTRTRPHDDSRAAHFETLDARVLPSNQCSSAAQVRNHLYKNDYATMHVYVDQWLCNG
jgi:hypothetical protein